MRACPPSTAALAQWGDGTFATIADDFSVPRPHFWCDADMPTGEAAWGPSGLTLSIPDYTTVGSTSWTNSELVSEPSTKTGMSMSARISPMDLEGVQGSRGWGFWNESLRSSTGEVDLAWFFYQDGSVCPGVSCPKGLFVMTQGIGSPKLDITFLPTKLLSEAHTYTVTLGKDAVTYYVDGNVVANVTDPELIPAGRMQSHVWVDNNFYNLAGNFMLAPQLNAVATSFNVRWWWQGPTEQVPMGPAMHATAPGTQTTGPVAAPPACRPRTLTVRLRGRRGARVTAVRVWLDGKPYKRFSTRRRQRLLRVKLSGLPSTGRHTVRIDVHRHRRLLGRVSRTIKGCAS